MTLSPIDLIRKARVSLYNSNPFFSYLTMYLRPVECDDEWVKKNGEMPSMGVDVKGNLYYNPEFVNKLSDEERVGVLCHEVMHVALCHFDRAGSRDRNILNIAQDIVINDIIIENNFKLPELAIIPSNHNVTIAGIKIKDTNKKSAEEVYNELIRHAKKVKVACICGNCKSKGKDSGKVEGSCKGFDKHVYPSQPDGTKTGTSGKNSKGKSIDGDGNDEIPNVDWKKALAEAAEYSKQRGNIPSGLDRWIKEVLYPKMPWREILYKYITREIPSDFTYMTQSKKSIATGIYMPNIYRETVDVVVSVDTSGSISQEQLTEFMSEIIGIAKAFSSIRMNVIICDCNVSEAIEVRNGNIDKLMELKLTGGGGTSANPVVEYINENLPNTKIWVYLTDGFTELSIPNPYHSLWVLTEGGTDEVANKCENVDVIWLL